MPKEDLRDRLAHVRWVGGGSGAGKSTIAARLAEKHGLRVYGTDATIRDHLERTTAATHPLVHAFAAMTMDERWVDRSPAQMLATFHGFQGEGFELLVEEVLAMPTGQPVLVEGFRLLPRLVAPLLSSRRAAVWLLPSPRFRRAAFRHRGTTESMLSSTSDPARALEHLLERDHLFTDIVATEAQSLGLQTIQVDVGMTVDHIEAAVSAALGLTFGR